MAREHRLKYPDCEECSFLWNMGVDDKQINDLHEDKITVAQLPKIAQKFLKKWREKKGYLPSNEGKGGEINVV